MLRIHAEKRSISAPWTAAVCKILQSDKGSKLKGLNRKECVIMDDRTFKRRCLYVAVTILGLFAIIALLWNIGDILGVCAGVLGKLYHYVSPLMYAFFIAYLIFIPVSYMETVLQKNDRIASVKPQRLRAVTILVTYVGIIALIAVIVASIYIMIGGQLSRNTGINDIINYILNYASEIRLGDKNLTDNPTIKEMMAAAEEWVQKYLNSSMSLNSLSTRISEIGSSFVIGIISLIISIYFTFDYENLTKRMKKIYMDGPGRTDIGLKVFNAVNIFSRTFKQFLRGQLLEACIVAALSVVALRIAGVSYFGIIGMIAGICNLVPFIGPWIGAVVAVAVSLLGGGLMTAVWAVLAMIIVQQIDNHLLAPKIVGDSVGLHPVITMVVLLVGADIGGIIGMLLAVPTAATVKKLLLLRVSHHTEDESIIVTGDSDNSEDDAADESEHK